MKHLVLPILLSSLSLAAACSKSEDKATKPAAEPTAPKATEPTLPETPRAAVYSAEAGAAALAEMAKCESPYSCDSLETVVGFGTNVSKELSAIATDSSKAKPAREVALAGLKKIKDPTVGMALFEAAKTEEDSSLQRGLFGTAGASGGDDTFTAMITHYASDESKEHRTAMRSGLREFGGKALSEWVYANYPEEKENQVRYADLVVEADEGADAAKVVALLGKTKHIMAGHRLAMVAVKLGDESQISVLIDGLKSSDQYDRSDAANFLEDVADKIPADRKQEVIDLVTAAKAKDAGGLTAMGYDKVLKKLGAQ